MVFLDSNKREKKGPVHVIGAGLAGSEAAYFLAEHGVPVILYEMRPQKMTPAHKTALCAELVCSNSLKSQDPESAPGILKREMSFFPSLVLKIAQETWVPGGQALSVDRNLFATQITQAIQSHPLIQIRTEEVLSPFLTASQSSFQLIATGPLTSDPLIQWLKQITDEQNLYFYDAIAPIVDASSLQLDKGFFANRYDKGEEIAYLNFPLSKEQYDSFVTQLNQAEKVNPHGDFEKEHFFQACQPIEAIAASGKESLRFGPMKPVGLTDVKTGKRPYAVLQLRPENQSKTAYNLVGFQTKLTYSEQRRVFSLIPGLEQAEFLRFGSIHRNTYVCGPKVLNPNLSLKKYPHLFLAGQLTGVEGYLESAACGLLAAFFILEAWNERFYHPPPPCSAMGSLHDYITQNKAKQYVPTNVHFGILYDHAQKQFQMPPSSFKKEEWRQKIVRESHMLFLDWRNQW